LKIKRRKSKLPKPYYETPLGKLYHGDCLEIMPQLEPVDLVLTDPPYGKGFDTMKKISVSNKAKVGNYDFSDWNNKPPQPEFFKLIKKNKNQIIFGGNYFVEWLYNSPCWLVWNKDNTGNFADCELAWTSFKTATRIIKYRWNGMLKEAPEKRYHPTQKPAGLFMWILNKYGSENWTTLDTHLGSGTTAIACERLKRKWIGIEIEEKYCEIAAKRIEREVKLLDSGFFGRDSCKIKAKQKGFF